MRSKILLVSAMFLVSGATGLLYEVAFSKVLATIFGATAYAVSTVLAAFMAGLALGAHLGGRVAARLRRHLAAYGVAEVLVGLICATTPWVFQGLVDAYLALAASTTSLAALTAVRAVLTFVVIVVPTSCMGATLPLLSRVVAASGEGEKLLPRLYAINTLGGAFGSLAAAYAILPTLGIRGTMRAAAVVNVVIGVVAFVRGRADDSGRAPPDKDETLREAGLSKSPHPDGAPRLAGSLLFFALASGFLVFATEVVETHLLALLIGNSAYAFGLMLAVFLLCLGFGATRAAALAQKHGAEGALARGLLGSSISLALTIPLWDQLPRFFAAAGKVIDSWAGREICRAVAAFLILALPTIFMGTTFPLLLSRVAKRATVAKDVATLTVFNTLGTILGSVTTGYLVLPVLGSQRTLEAVAIAFAVLGAASVWSLPLRRSAAWAALAAILISLILPKWDLARLTNGANVYFTYGPPPDDIVFVREDVHGGVTTVARRGELLTLYTNGKFQGDDGPEMKAQRRFAHFPSLFLREEKRALVIGLGTGVTLGTVTAYPFEHIDVAEISPAIVEAARKFYAGPARGGLDDPRVRLELNDGRNVLLTAKQPYDLITIELTSVWFAGASNLYSTDFYQLTKRKLAPGGVLQQWVQLHHIRPRELAAIIRTLHREFAHVALFEGGAQGILVASDAPLVASRARLARLAERPDIVDTLDGRTLESLLDEMIASDGELERLCADAASGEEILSTDDNLFLEYATPKGNVLNYHASLEDTLALLRRYKPQGLAGRHIGP